MYQEKEEKFLQKMSPHLSQLNVAIWLIGIILGKIICKSSNWQHMQRLKINILGGNCQLFRLEIISNCSYFYFVYTKHQVLLICNENKEIFVANLMVK